VRFMAGVDAEPFSSTLRAFETALALLTLAGTALAAALGWWIARIGLGPVQRLSADAQRIGPDNRAQRLQLPALPRELADLGASFNAALDRLDAAYRQLETFNDDVAHELRTPLANLLAETDLALRRERSGESYRAALTAIHRSAEQMSRILETLITAAQAEPGLRRGTSDGGAAARRAAADGEERPGERVDVAAPNEAMRLGVDGDVVERILAPLVENARRHARSRVTIDLVRDGSAAAFVVGDDGPGVAEVDRERIFEPGVSVNGSQGSAGLGLALARRLARAAGGDVRCLPGSGGARFELRLPAA